MDDRSINEVAPGVYTFEHEVVQGKNLIIIGSRGAIAVDTGMNKQDGEAMAEFIRGMGCRADRLAITHGHYDHILGSEAFCGSEVYAHRLCPEVLEERIPTWRGRFGIDPEEIKPRLAWPTVCFGDRLQLDLGEPAIELIPTPGHSRDAVSLHIPEHRLLFAGDTVVTCIVPAISLGDGRALEQSLALLIQYDIEILVPGHGHVLFGGAEIRRWLSQLLRYLQNVRKQVRERLKTESDPQRISDGVAFEEFVPGELATTAYDMDKRHRDVVIKIIHEERGDVP